MYSKEQVMENATRYFAAEALPASVWTDKYALKTKDGALLEATPSVMHERLAGEFARIDADLYNAVRYGDSTFKEACLDALSNFSRIVLQGSPMAAIGNPHQVMSASNCVVVESPHDSIAGIMKAGTELAQLMKRRCGVGIDISTLRPDGMSVNNAARTTSGAWSFADFFSYVTRMIGQEGRRGALMITIGVHHPDVIKFARMKSDLKKVTGANVSIRLSNDFMAAVEADATYEQYWPPVGEKTISKMVRAREVWDVLIDQATKFAEPGLIYWDTMTSFLPAHSYKRFRTVSTNPCVTGDSWVFTSNGPRQVNSLLSKQFYAIVNGSSEASTTEGFFYTGHKDVFKITTSHGFELKCTDNHKIKKIVSLTRYKKTTSWTELKDLAVGDRIDIQQHRDVSWPGHGSEEEGWLLGNLLGDGTFTDDYAKLQYWGETRSEMHSVAVSAIKKSLTHRADIGTSRGSASEIKNITSTGLKCLAEKHGIVRSKIIEGEAIETSSSSFYCGFIRGLFDADGTVFGSQNKGVAVRLSSIHLHNLKVVQRMLARLGIISKIYKNRKSAGFNVLPNGIGGSALYLTNATNELHLSGENAAIFAERIGFKDPIKQSRLLNLISSYKRSVNRERFVTTIVSIEKIGSEAVYDCTIPSVSEFDANGLSVHNCSEIALSPYDSCRLISLNLTGYVRSAFTNPSFDFNLFKKDIRLAARMADNLVDLELELIRRIQASCDGDEEKGLWQKLHDAGKDGRRVGIGTHGLADMLAQLCIKYDSEEAIAFVDKLYSILLFEAYNTSVDLAIERGPFPEWSWEVEKDNAFIQNLPAELRARIQKHGRRNIAMLTQAPTGSISIISKCGEFDRFNVSSGVEPVFRNFYIRRKKINSNQGGRVDFVDALGDQWQEYPVFHPNVKNYFEKVHGLKLNVPDDQMTQEQIKELLDIKLPSYFVTSDQIDWTYRVKLQGVEQLKIDHSISSCITAGHRINTDAGLKLIEDIVPKDLPPKTFTKPADDLYVVNHEGRRVKIDEVYNNGLAECVKVSFGAGLSITCTKNHKLLTLNKEYQQEWIEAGDLTKDHYIICRTGLECFGDCQKYISSIMGKFSSPLLQMRGGTKAVSIPKRMSCELSRLIGYIMSDGYVGENGVGLTQVQNNVVDDFVRLVKNIFGVNSAIIKDARSENLVNVRVNSRIIRDYFEYLGLTRDHSTIRVPRAIFECAGRQQVAEFIRGITLDGHVAGDQIIVHTTVSKLFAHDTVSLLNQFGIASNIAIRPAGERMFPGRKTYKTKESYVVYCGRESGSKFLEYIGFAEDRKTLEAKTKFRHASRKTSLGSVPDFGIRAAVRKNLLPQVKSDRLYNIVHSATSKWKNKFDLSRETLKLFCDIGFRLPNNILLNDTYVFRKPTKIENVGVLQTYDLHVKDGNSYVVNDIVSHNTTNLPKGTTSDTVGQIYLEGWKAGLKGITVYVDGSRDGVLITDSAPKQKPKDGAAKRHKSLSAEVHTATVGGNKWVVLVGLMDGAPYEVFTGLASHFNLDTKPDSANIVKLSKGRYDLEIQSGKDKVVFPNIIESFNNPQGAWATRLVSLSLRHNVPLEYIVDSLSKDGKLNDINRVLARVLKKYMADGKKVTLSKTCTNCNSSNLLYQEGCPKCLDCGYTKCN